MMANERRPCCSQAKQSVLDSMIYSAKRTVTEERKPSESETLDSPIVSFFLRKCFLPLAYKRAHVAYGHERSIIDYSAACRCVPHRVPAPNAYARKRGARAMLFAMLHARGARGRNAILEHASPLLGSGLGKIGPWMTPGIVTAGRGPGRSGRGAWSAGFARGRGPSAYANPAHYWVASVASLPPSLPSSLSLIPPSVCSPKVGGSTTHLFQLQVVSLSSIADSELLCTAELVFTAYANSTSEHTGRILRNLSWSVSTAVRGHDSECPRSALLALSCDARWYISAAGTQEPPRLSGSHMLVRFAAKSSCSLLPQRGRRRQRQLSRCQRTRVLDDGECAPPSGAAEAGAAAAGALDDGENAPPSGAAEAGAAATGVRDDGARHPAAQPRPGRQRRGCAMTASARHPAVPSLPKHMTIPKASSCTRTLAYAIVFIVSICYLYTSSALVSFLVAAIASRGALESSGDQHYDSESDVSDLAPASVFTIAVYSSVRESELRTSEPRANKKGVYLLEKVLRWNLHRESVSIFANENM